PLYGHEMDATVLPDEAGLSHAIRSDAEFVGRRALERRRAAGIQRSLIGLVVDGPHIPRQGAQVLRDGAEAGSVCSGTRAPTLAANIATARVDRAAAAASEFVVAIRRHHAPARRADLPFYKRPRTGTPSGPAALRPGQE